MKKAAFFLDTARLQRAWTLDATTQALSGTDTIILQIAGHCCLKRTFGQFFATSAPDDSPELVTVVPNLTEAARQAKRAGIEKMVFIGLSTPEQKALLKSSEPLPGLIPILQNTPDFEYLHLSSRSSTLHHLICVSNRQAYMQAAYRAFSRILVIPNFVDTEFWQPDNSIVPDDRITYIGALKDSKGFQHLADAWPSVHARLPHYRLDVCGSPGLYQSGARLGTQGIAEAEFEQRILAPLGGSRASADALGVRFLGSVSKRTLRDQLSRSRAAVVNPNTTGSVETFCVSAAEALAMERPLVGGAAGALLEVVGHHQGGLLAHNTEEIAAHLIFLAENREQAQTLGKRGRQRTVERYATDVVLGLWERFLYSDDTSGLRPAGTENRSSDYWLRTTARLLHAETLGQRLKRLRHGAHSRV